MTNILMFLAVMPGLAILFYVYKLDKIEKEPRKLLMKLLFLGAVSCGPAVIFELLAGKIIGSFFIEGDLIYSLLDNFLGVALIEEGCKYFFLKRSTWKNRAFDYRFDAVVYAIFTSLGFAILENILYVLGNGFGTAFMRMFTAIPGHAIFALYMGHYYGEAKMSHLKMDTKSYKKNKWKALWIPIGIHGTYDFLCSAGSLVMLLGFFVFVIAIEIIAFRRIRKYAREDMRVDGFVEVKKKYLKPVLNTNRGVTPSARTVKQQRPVFVISEGAGDLPHYDCFAEE